ncbi:MAG: acyltransferase [Flavobacteriales bacterium]|nr:acyltransferase [Flavobacteriales bacterium]
MGLIRLILAISVVVSHSGSIFGIRFVGGQMAVQSFYIISGFYMALILTEKYIGPNGSYRLFISNRLLRLFPVYWTVALLTLIISSAAYFVTGGDDSVSMHAFHEHYKDLNLGSFLFLMFTNVFLVLQDVVMFLGLDIETGKLFFTTNFRNTDPALYKFLMVPQAWTIGIEITFYLIAPFLVKRKWSAILTLIALSLTLRVILYTNGLTHDPWTHRFFPTELVFFLFGIVAYRLYKMLEHIPISPRIMNMIFGTVLVATITYTAWPIKFKPYIYLTLFFISLPFIFIHTKRWKFDRYIGELSYPVYISHMLVIGVFGFFDVEFTPVMSILLIGVTLAFSFALNAFIAAPLERTRQSRVKTVKSPVSVVNNGVVSN